MLSLTDLKTWVHRDIKRLDKLLLVLSSLDSPCQIKDIRKRALEAGLSIPKKWNLTAYLRSSEGLAIKTPVGWEITESGKQHLQDLGVTKISPEATDVTRGFRTELSKIKDTTTRSFIDESIKCCEAGLYRSAIVMSWISAVAVLYNHVHTKHLEKFNTEAKRIDPKWKDANTTDDISKMRESDFLDRIEKISIIGKDVKKELKLCLDRRNSCCHPNSLSIGASTAAHHVEILLLNVFKPLQ